MTKMEAYKYLQDHRAGFIANVVLCQHSEPAKKLKALARLVELDHTVSFAQFSIDTVLVDGRARTWQEILKFEELLRA